MPEPHAPQGALLVGSVPLSSGEEVFRAAGSILGGRLRRIPDGETGVRKDWFQWQKAVFEPAGMEPVTEGVLGLSFRLPAGVDGTQLRFGQLGYAAHAVASYEVFKRLRAEGAVPEGCRFQVSLPTPLAPVSVYVNGPDQAAVEISYTRRLLAEVEEITAAIPHEDLAIQWDTAMEFAMLEGVLPAWFDEVERGVVDRLVTLGRAIPGDVELGYHLCYGDMEHKHFTEPEDTTKLVRVANGVAAGLSRPVNWLHLPVPRNRDDDAYMAPLAGLRLHPETELYLGLVHHTDGVEGTRRRIAAAQRAVGAFGVGTECGMGRRPSETIPDVLRIHATVAQPVRG